MIIPLLFANETGPELDIQDDETLEVGKYRYEPNVAIMLGDDAVHGTSAVNYLKDFRMGITVYVSEIDEESLESTVEAFTQMYPPVGSYDLLESWAGRHWDSNDPTKKLPRPPPDRVLFQKASHSAENSQQGPSPSCDDEQTAAIA